MTAEMVDRDVGCCGGVFDPSKKLPLMDGLGLLDVGEDDAAEFRLEAESVAIRPRARMALPVFYTFR